MTLSRRLSLYHRRGCHLCDEMLEAVEHLLIGRNIEIVMVDIAEDPVLIASYGEDIPVLFAGSYEICRHRLDADRLLQWLSPT